MIDNSESTPIRHSPFNQMKIGMRVGLSFVVILAIFIATSLFSLDIFSQSQRSFSDYSKVSSEAISILDIDRQVSEMQRVILAYSNTGHKGIIRRAKSSHQTLVNNLITIQNTIHDETRLDLLQRMTKKLEDYGENVDALVESREQRDRLIDESMISLTNDTSIIITELSRLADRKQDVALAEEINVIHKQLLRAQVDAVSFLGNRRHSFQQNAKNFLNQAKEKTLKLYQPGISPVELKALVEQLEKNISAYENVFYQAVQATRAYLFLVNVVMAGEAAEFTTLSQTLKASTISTLSVLTESTKERLGEAQQTTTVVTIVAMIFGLILAFLISRSLSRPIREIALTFSQLVSDKHDTIIPGLDRGDEIGQLAKAANIFKEMSERTKNILAESQALANELQLRENQLEKQTMELQKSNDELDNFAYVASHDLKSPLRAIDNLSKWIREDCEEILPEESREHLDKMQQRVGRMENLLADLLNYSRVGRVDVAIDTINSVELVENVVELINKPDHITIHIDQNLPEITTQVSPLQQVFLNLFTNAVKYNDKDEGTIHVTSKLLNDDFVEFCVSDNGPGIEPEFHERIFQMFQTLQPRDVMEGSGMGLAIIKKVIEGQGGEIGIESAAGQGAMFRFSWPTSITVEQEAA